MKLKQKLWSALLKLPSFIKTPVLRKSIVFPNQIANTLRFKVAETEDELAQAFTLLHDAYVGEKLMQPHPSGMRITKYHALPSTTTLIAIENNQVVGTVSLIRQSSFGLPLSAIFNLSDVSPAARLAEVSALAIKKEYMQQRGRILFPLLKFLFHYSSDYFGVSHFVIAVNPKWIDFYTSILCFERLTQKSVENYSFVNGAPAVGAILNLQTTAEVYYKTYGTKKKTTTLYNFFHNLACKNMEFPLRKKSIISDPILSPQLLKHFFIDRSDCLKDMNDLERSILREMYDRPSYLELITPSNLISLRKKRLAKRFEMNLNARLVSKDNKSVQMVIQEISASGFGGFIEAADLNIDEEQKVLVNIEELTPCELTGRFVRLTEKGRFGFSLSQTSDRWSHLVKELDARLYASTQAQADVAYLSDQVRKKV